MIKKKYKLKPLMKHQLIVVGIGVFAFGTMILGSSYAIFTKSKVVTESSHIQVGNLELEYVDLSESEDGLSLNSSYPVSDEVGSTGKSYRFSVENVGSIKATYDIVIVDDMSILENEDCEAIQLDKKYIRYKLDNGKIGTLADLYNETLGGYVIQTSSLAPSETDIHEIRLWLDGTSPNEVVGKHFHGKITIVIAQAKEEETS